MMCLLWVSTGDSFFNSQRIIQPKIKKKKRNFAQICNSAKLKTKEHFPLVDAIVSQFKVNESEL